MTVLWLPRGTILFFLAAILFSTSCTKRAEVAAAAEASSAPVAAPDKSGIVTLGPDSPQAHQITIEPVQMVSLPADEVIAPARIQLNPNRVAHAVLPVGGRITRVMVRLGDAVTKGQPVALVDSPAVADAESAFAQAQSAVHQAELAVAKADADLTRLMVLFEHGATAEKEVLSTRTTLALAKDALEQAHIVREQGRRRLELLGLKAGELQQQVVVDAPLSGKVLSIDVAAGEYRNETSASLITIGDLSQVWATSDVPESDIRYCKIGGAAELELIAYPGEVFHALVTRIADTVDKDTRTIQVSAELENTSGRLRPEMYGRLHYGGALASTLWVPEAAVVEDNGKDFVFVELSPSRFQAVQVQLGRRHNSGFAILKGLKPGDKVATQGAVYLKAAL